MLTPDEETQVRALLDVETPLRALLEASRLDEGEVTALRRILPQQGKLLALLQDAQTIGSPALLRRLFVLVAEGTQTVADATTIFVPVEKVVITTAAAAAHSFYLASAYVNTDIGAGTIQTHQTGTFKLSTTTESGFHVGITKFREAGPPDEVVVSLQIHNNSGTQREVLYRVYRVAGLT